MRRALRTYGFTLLEMLITVAVLSLLTALGVGQLRPPAARLFASSLKAQLVQARLEAVKRNRPVSVLWDATSQSFLTQVKSDEDSTALPCATSDQTLGRQLLVDYPKVRVEATFSPLNGAAAIVWYPSGLPRFCDGSGVPTTTSSTRVSDSRTTFYVKVAAGGRVEVTDAQ